MVKTNYIPSRKIVAGGVSGILAWAILSGLGYYNVPVPEEWQALLPTILATIVSYIVPPATQDVIRRIDDKLIAIAGADPDSAVSREVGAVAARVVRETGA